MAPKKPYKRVLLKLTGEAFGSTKETFDSDAASFMASEIKDVLNLGAEVAVVVGGGNVFRGRNFVKYGRVKKILADYMGMLATVQNGLFFESALEDSDVTVRVHSALEIRAVAEPYIRKVALRDLGLGRVVILTGGTGRPQFSTDTAAALCASELGAEAILKGTTVNGVYDEDPRIKKDARLLRNVSLDEVRRLRLQFMDSTAIEFMLDNCRIPIHVFNIFKKGNLKKVVLGERVGSTVTP